MTANSPPAYITLDLDVVSASDLSPLKEYLEDKSFVLGHQKIEGLFYLSFEPNWIREECNSPETSTQVILELLFKLPPEIKVLWEDASAKTFNFGFESGTEGPPYISDISPSTLKKISEVGAGITITIYQHYPSPQEQ